MKKYYFPIQKSRKITSRISSTSTRHSSRPTESPRILRFSAASSSPSPIASMLRSSEAAVCCSNFRCRSRLIRPPSPEPKQSPANAIKAAINCWIPSPRLAEILTSAVRQPARKTLPGCPELAESILGPALSGPSRSILLRTVHTGTPPWGRFSSCCASTSHNTRPASSARARARPTPPPLAPPPPPPPSRLLHRIVGLANPGGVDHRHRIPLEIELHFDDVPRRAGVRRDDRDLAPRQLIHQRRLADVRWPGDRDHQPLAQPLTSPLRRKHFPDFAEQRFDLGKRRRDQLSRHVIFVGEIDSRFDQRGGLDDLGTPVARFVAEQTFQVPQRLPALPIGVGVNQIVETFCLGEIELAILKRAPSKLARLRRAHFLKA